MKCADLSRRLFQVLPTASARRERPVTSTPPGGSALLIVSLLALKVILTGSNNWYDHTDWAGSAPPESNSGSLESNGASVIEQFALSHFQDKLSVGVE